MGVALFTPDGRIIQINKRFCDIIGYRESEILENTLQKITHPDDLKEDIRMRERLLNREIPNYHLEKRYIKKDKSTVWVKKTVSLVSETSISPNYFIAVVEDITENKRAHIQIEKDLHEKEVLLQEVHHRVKNNLQVISSLLNLQSDHINNKEALATLKESQNRVRAMALVHEKLYQSHDFSHLDFSIYVGNLINSLFHSYHIEKDTVHLNMKLESFSLPVDRAVPCGLIINELVSNALKYAFPPNFQNERDINVSLQKDNHGQIQLDVEDTGIGFPENFNYREADSLGLHLVVLLVEKQLEGTITLKPGKGTHFHILFQESIE